jgi:hypothetical protein
MEIIYPIWFKKVLLFTILCSVTLGCTSGADNSDDIKNDSMSEMDYKFDMKYKTSIKNLEIRQIIKTQDGNYVGIAFSQDFHIIKFDSNFNIIWEKKYGGSKKDYAESILEDTQGNLIILGNTESTDGNITVNNGSYDLLLIKTDSNGNLIWSKTFGGSGHEGVSQQRTIIETSNNDLIIIGFTNSSDFGIINYNNKYNAWLVKVDKSGNLLKQKSYGGYNDDFGRKIIKHNDNLLISVKSNSIDNDFTQVGNWILNIDNDLDVKWKRNTQGINSGDLIINKQNEIIVVNSSFTDFEVHVLDINGNIKKSKNINFLAQTNKQPTVNQIVNSNDGGVFVIGDLGLGNDQDAVIFKINKNLVKTSEKFTIGNSYDKSKTLIPTQINQFIYLLNSSSTNLEVSTSGNMFSIIAEIEEK